MILFSPTSISTWKLTCEPLGGSYSQVETQCLKGLTQEGLWKLKEIQVPFHLCPHWPNPHLKIFELKWMKTVLHLTGIFIWPWRYRVFSRCSFHFKNNFMQCALHINTGDKYQTHRFLLFEGVGWVSVATRRELQYRLKSLILNVSG